MLAEPVPLTEEQLRSIEENSLHRVQAERDRLRYEVERLQILNRILYFRAAEADIARAAGGRRVDPEDVTVRGGWTRGRGVEINGRAWKNR